MPRKRQLKGLIKTLKDADDMCKLFTGKSIQGLAKRGWELYGEDIKKKGEEVLTGVKSKPLDSNNPYFILGVREDAADLVIKTVFRSLAKEYHPDTGDKPDAVKFQKVCVAYNAIMEIRKNRNH